MQNEVDYILDLEIAGQIPEGKKILGQQNELLLWLILVWIPALGFNHFQVQLEGPVDYRQCRGVQRLPLSLLDALAFRVTGFSCNVKPPLTHTNWPRVGGTPGLDRRLLGPKILRTASGFSCSELLFVAQPSLTVP